MWRVKRRRVERRRGGRWRRGEEEKKRGGRWREKWRSVRLSKQRDYFPFNQEYSFFHDLQFGVSDSLMIVTV